MNLVILWINQLLRCVENSRLCKTTPALFQPVPVSCKTSKEGSSAEFIHAAVPGFILYNIMEVVVAFLRSKLKSPRRIVAVFFPHVQIHSNPRSDMKSIKTFSVKYELQIR